MTIFNFLSSLLLQLTYLFLLNSFFFLSTFSVFLKRPNNYLFKWLAYRFLLGRLSVLFCIQLFLKFFKFQVFQAPGFSESRFFRLQVFQNPGFSRPWFPRVQVFLGEAISGSASRFCDQGLSPGFRSSQRNPVLCTFYAV